MQNQSLQHQFYHMEVDLMIIGKARNIIVETTMAQIPDVDVLWFIDNDVMIPAHAGVLIDNALEYNIVSGLYFSRHVPYTPQMYRLSPRPLEEGMYEPIMEYPETGFVMAQGVGAGCLAVRREVFEVVKASHLKKFSEMEELIAHKIRYDGRAKKAFAWLLEYARTLSPWFEFLDKKGEDFYFCERARDAGYMIFVNLDVKCEHVGPTSITEGHFQFLKENNMYIRLGPDGQPTEPHWPAPAETNVVKEETK